MESTIIKENPRYEVINGKTMMMSPSPAISHNTIITNLTRIFGNYLYGKRCRNFSDGVDVHLDNENTVIPDAMIICNRDIIKNDGIYGAPDLVVEIISPATARRDKREKKLLYEKNGVKEYWIIDPVSKSIEVHLLQSGKYELDNVYAIYPDWQWTKMTEEEKSNAALSLKVSLYDDLIIDIKEIFRNVD